MATYGYTFQSGDGVTPTRLNDARTVSDIVNADIKSDAAIAHSKLANITAGQVLLGNASNVPTATALTGDVTVTSGGVTAIGSAKVVTSMINNAAVTAAKLDGAQTGSAPIYGCRAWVNFNGTTADNIGGTYSRTLTTVTVTTTAAHNLEPGHIVFLDFTSGAAVDGAFTVVSVPSTTEFTVTHGTSGTTSGNVTLNRRLIRAGGNVASVTYHAVGNYVINFSTAMPDANYCVTGIASSNIGAEPNAVMVAMASTTTYGTKTDSAVQIFTADTNAIAVQNCFDVNVLIFR
jgi:hypothetical protein